MKQINNEKQRKTELKELIADAKKLNFNPKLIKKYENQLKKVNEVLK